MLIISVPTLNRHVRLKWIFDNINSCTSGMDYKICFVVEDNDKSSIDEVQAIIDMCIENKSHDHVCMVKNIGRTVNTAVNEMYRETKSDLIYLSCDDLEFTGGWLIPLIDILEKNPKTMVVATNDGYFKNGNSGFLIRRSYIDKLGGVIDKGPGTIYNEDYDHLYGDTELVGTAKKRGVFAHCSASLVWHQHYSHSKKYKRDSTAEHNERRSINDRDRWNSRCHLFDQLKDN